MLSEHSVEQAARAAGVTSPVHFFGVTGSTNEDLFRFAEQGAPEWAVVVAARQLTGRGRLGRTWTATPNTSLLISTLLRPTFGPAYAPLLSLLAGVSAVEAIRRACGVTAVCKWPNDLVVGDRKLGGILTEASVEAGRVSFVVLGTGINVAQAVHDFPADLRVAATSIAIEGGTSDIEGLLREYLVALRKRYDAFNVASRRELIDAYRSVCATIGRRVRATVAGGRTIEGRAVDVGDGGELVVETSSGVERVGSGEVIHLR